MNYLRCSLGLLLVGLCGCRTPESATGAGSVTPVTPGFCVTGAWNYSGLQGWAPGKCTLYSDQPGATATWTPGITSASPVRVAFHVVTHKSGNDPKVRVEVTHSGQTEVRCVDTSQGGSRWENLGTFNFSGKGDETVRAVKETDKTYTRVSALRFEILDPQRPDFVWQTLVMDDPVLRLQPGAAAPPSEAEQRASVNGGPPEPEKWVISFADDFNGARLDPDVWASAQNEAPGTHLSTRWPENAVVQTGGVH